MNRETKQKKVFIQQVLEYTISHLFDLLTIFLAGFVVIRNQFEPYTINDIVTLINILIGILALIASSSLWQNSKYTGELMRLVTKTFELVSTKLDQDASSSAFFRNKPELQNYIQNAKKIYFCGVNLTNTIDENLASIQGALDQGREVRILIIDPESTALEVAGRRTNTGLPNYYVTKLETTFQLLQLIYSNSSKANNKLHVGLLPYPPSFGILGFDLDAKSETSKIIIEIYLHKIKDKAPRFELTPTKDALWYSYFSEQFNKMWSDARTWEPVRLEKNQKKG